MFQTLEPSSGSAHVDVKTSQSQQIGASRRLYGSGGITSALCSLRFPHRFVFLTTLFHRRLIPAALIRLSFLSPLSFLSSPLTLLLFSLASPPPPPSSLLQSLARCLVHATGRSLLTDGWMARAEAIRHWAEWNRTCPIHYQDSRLCLIFNLYFPGARWQRTLSTFEQNPALFCFRSAVTFWIPSCSFSSAGHLSHFGKVKYHQKFLCFFCVFFFFSLTVWQALANETDP